MNLVSGKDDWLNFLKDDLREKVKPYQIALFFINANQKKWDHHRLIINKLIEVIPSITIDTEQLALTGNSTSFESPTFVNPRQAATYVMVNNRMEVSEAIKVMTIKDFFDLFVYRCPINIQNRNA